MEGFLKKSLRRHSLLNPKCTNLTFSDEPFQRFSAEPVDFRTQISEHVNLIICFMFKLRNKCYFFNMLKCIKTKIWEPWEPQFELGLKSDSNLKFKHFQTFFNQRSFLGLGFFQNMFHSNCFRTKILFELEIQAFSNLFSTECHF